MGGKETVPGGTVGSRAAGEKQLGSPPSAPARSSSTRSSASRSSGRRSSSRSSRAKADAGVKAESHPKTQEQLKPQEPVAGTPGAPAPTMGGTAAQSAGAMEPGAEVSGSADPGDNVGKEPKLEPKSERPIGSAQPPVNEQGG